MKIKYRRSANPGFSFIIARKEELSQIQKDAIIDFVVNRMLGKRIISDVYELEEYLEEESEYIDENLKEKLQESIRKELPVFSGRISFQGKDGTASLFRDLWTTLENADDTAFSRIDMELIP